MDQLKEAFVERPENDLKQRLAEVYADDRAAMREAEWEINNRLRPIRRD
jgi:neutral trehalase